MELGDDLSTLRQIRGWTQEQLAERSGLSVRTIRNVELGWVENPRRSSIDLLFRALGANRSAEFRGDRAHWRGLPPPGEPLVGRAQELDDLVGTVTAHRLTTILGAGGVGKTRTALAVAAEARRCFRDGVAVVELGDLPAESAVAAPVRSVLERAQRFLPPVTGPESAIPPSDRTDGSGSVNLLVVLDNAEHVPAATTVAIKELLSTYPALHVLVTTRRPLTGRLGVNRVLDPLPVASSRPGDPAHPSAVELVLRRAGHGSPHSLTSGQNLADVTELCRRLEGNPRALEFAVDRLRTIPLRALLASGPVPELLRTSDHALLPHQRSMTSSVEWSMGLLGEEHRWLLRQLADLPVRRFTLDDVLAAGERARGEQRENVLSLFSDLIENFLVALCRDQSYEYRLVPYAREVIRAAADPATRPEPELSH